MAIYSVAQAAELTGYSRNTLHQYTSGNKSTLDRGPDFFVRRSRSRLRRNILFTDRGILRLQLGAFKYLDHARRLPLPTFPRPRLHDVLRNVDGREALLRLRSIIISVLLEYPDVPCTTPACPCMSHRLGLPTAQELLDAGLYDPSGGGRGGKGKRKI